MSLTLNMIGGSTSNFSTNNAILHVGAPYGSTITITDGTTTKIKDYTQSYINNYDQNRADYYFPILSSEYGTWTVTSVLGTDSSSGTITINAIREYDIELDYRYYLYKEGDECISKTGGWEVKWEKSKRASKEADYLNMTSAESNGQCISTINKVNLTNFSRFCMRLNIAASGNTKYHNAIVWSGGSSAKSASTVANWEFGNIAAGNYSVNIASLSGTYILGFRCWNGAAMRIGLVWLE